MTHRGAALMEWAHQQVVAFQSRPNQPGGTPLAVLVAEAYLHGANDALQEESARIQTEAQDGLAQAAAAVQADPRFILPPK